MITTAVVWEDYYNYHRPHGSLIDPGRQHTGHQHHGPALAAIETIVDVGFRASSVTRNNHGTCFSAAHAHARSPCALSPALDKPPAVRTDVAKPIEPLECTRRLLAADTPGAGCPHTTIATHRETG